MKVSKVQATELGVGEVPVRESVLASVLAGLQAAQLSGAEYLGVVGAIHGLLAQSQMPGKTAMLVTATALVEGRATSYSDLVATTAPYLVAETVSMLATQASPALWGQIRAVLEATDEQLAAYQELFRA